MQTTAQSPKHYDAHQLGNSQSPLHHLMDECPQREGIHQIPETWSATRSSNHPDNPLHDGTFDHDFYRESTLCDMEHSMLLFTEICNLMELDRAWLTKEHPNENTLLFRYFSNHVRRVKDLIDYRGLLRECLHTIQV